MSPPIPRLVKIGRNGEITFESKCDLAQWTIQELTRRAMIDVGKYIITNVRINVETAFPFAKGKKGKKRHKNSERYQYWVPKKENYLVLGIENRKKGAVTAWWADQLELDSFVIPPRGKRKESISPGKAKSRAAKKSGKKSGFPLGTANVPRRHLLETFTKKHIDKIVEIESQYLKTINNEDAAVALARATEEMEVLSGDEN